MNQTLTPLQFRVLVVLNMLGSSLIYTPSMLTSVSKQDAWIALLIGFLLGILPVFLYETLIGRLGNVSIIEYCSKHFGVWCGKLVAAVLLVYTLLISVLILKGVTDFLSTWILNRTPISYMLVLMLGASVMAVRVGIGNIARSGEVFLPWILVGLTIFYGLLLPDIKVDNLKPMLEGGIAQPFRGGLAFLSFPIFELMVLVLCTPYLKKTNRPTRIIFPAYLIASLYIFGIVMLNLLVAGPYITEVTSFSSYRLAQTIRIADIFQRLEVFIAGMWCITIFYKFTIYFFSSNVLIQELTGTKNTRSYLLPLAMILLPLTQMAVPNTVYGTYFSSEVAPGINMVIAFLLPLAVAIHQLFTKRKQV